MRSVVDRTLTTKVVTYFNDLSDDRRVIPAGQLYTVRMFWNDHNISSESPEFEDGDTGAPYSRGEMTFLWVGPTGDIPQTAVDGNFVALSFEEAPAVDTWLITSNSELAYPLAIDDVVDLVTSNDGDNDGEYNTQRLNILGVRNQVDELWIDNPMVTDDNMAFRLMRIRPLYNLEQFVFIFPQITKDVLDNSPVSGGFKFAKFSSIKSLFFDMDMDIQVVANERTLSASENQFIASLYWQESNGASPVKILEYAISTVSGTQGSMTYKANDTANEDVKRNGRNGIFFWGLTNSGVSETNFSVEDLTITMIVKSSFKASDELSVWPAPPTETLFEDPFTASDNTLLTNYTTTGGWTSYANMGSGNGNADEFVIVNNRLRRVNWDATEGYTNGGEALALPTGMPDLAGYSDWTISFDFMFDAGTTNSQILLQDYNATRDYEVQRLYIFWNGGATVDVKAGTGTTMTYPIVADTVYQAKMVVTGESAQIFINDTFVASGSMNDSGDLPAGVLGVDMFNAGADSKVSIDNYKLTTP